MKLSYHLSYHDKIDDKIIKRLLMGYWGIYNLQQKNELKKSQRHEIILALLFFAALTIALGLAGHADTLILTLH